MVQKRKEGIGNMDFPTLFSILRKRLSDGYNAPMYCRELFAQLTEVSEEEWGTLKDPETKITKEATLRSFTKRGLSRKFAQAIVYRLAPDNLAARINERPVATRQLLSEDLSAYVPEVTADTVGKVIADMMVDIIRRTAGLVSQDALKQEKQRELFADWKAKYGDYLYEECDGFCPFPGCGKQLSAVADSKVSRVYEISLVDKTKKVTTDNLIALCPMCHATYQMDDSKAKTKELANVKALLITHGQSARLLDGIALEKGIVGVLRRLADLKEKAFFKAELDPKELTKKVNPTDNYILYLTVKNNVTTYFLKIREIMTNLDRRGLIDYEALQDQMKAIYKRLKKSHLSQMEIFREITEKLHRTSLQDDVYCQIVVCYFIQSCEVFDAVAE